MTKRSPILYTITLLDSAAHRIGVTLSISADSLHDKNGEQKAFIDLRMPAWIPGSYMIREFSRFVDDMRSTLPIEKIQQVDKATWRVDTSSLPNKSTLEITYTVYAFDTSVRAAYFASDRAFMNFSSVLLEAPCVTGPVDVVLEKPHAAIGSSWRVATALPSIKVSSNGFGLYRANNYDELIDHPVEIAEFIATSFQAGGAKHHIIISGMQALAAHVDLARLQRDFKRITEHQIAMFDPKTKRAPVKAYWFLVNTLPEAYGGLEHRASTALLCNRSSLPLKSATVSAGNDNKSYLEFLGLVSHEYFHTWNVKRIKPKAFIPYDTSQENYTRLLWIFEGFTSYYDDLCLLRAGLLTIEQYLERVATSITATLRSPGSQRDTAANSSFNAWTRYYRQDENSPNSIVSYYVKGSLIALCLDLWIRTKTADTIAPKSLDDVMRALWQMQKDPNWGLEEDAFPRLVKQVCGLDLSKQIHQWAYTSEPLPLKELLASHQIDLVLSAEPWAALGARVSASNSDIRLSTVYDNGPAHAAGLSSGDCIIAVDKLRANELLLQTLLKQSAGKTLTLSIFRRDVLLDVQLKVPTQKDLRRQQAKLSIGEPNTNESNANETSATNTKRSHREYQHARERLLTWTGQVLKPA